MLAGDIIAQLVFSAAGSETRITYITVATHKVPEYVGVTASINTPTSAARWYITKLEYDVDANVIRARRLSPQNIWDDRASLFT